MAILCLKLILISSVAITWGESSRPWYRKRDQRVKISDERTLQYNEAWDYVEVRPGAHLFYWLYANAQHDAATPLVLWLQGGPGASGVGFGNFEEIGPLTGTLKSRNTTWLQVADLLFIDNPVGTGFSYVENDSQYTKTVQEITADLLTFSRKFFGSQHKEYQNRPFYIYCESYGGKMTPHFAAELYQAIQKGGIKANLQGIGIGDGWVSAIDYVENWGPYLYATSLLDPEGLNKTQQQASQCRSLVESGRWTEAEACWSKTEGTIEGLTDSVSWYNILKRSSSDPWSLTEVPISEDTYLGQLYRRHRRYGYTGSLADLMNGPVKKRLKIIPENVSWGVPYLIVCPYPGQSGQVFLNQAGDFMKPVINSVDYLLKNTTVKVNVFNGQLDLICGTLGTIEWMEQLKWSEYATYKSSSRKPFHVSGDYQTAGFVKRHDRLSFYWIMRAGHMVAHDAADAALQMLKNEVSN